MRAAINRGLTVDGVLRELDALVPDHEAARYLWHEARPAWAERIANEVRSRTRRHEVAMFRAVENGEPIMTAVSRLVNDSFIVDYSGRRVAWLDATAEDHDARAAFLRKQAADSIRGAERHEWAAETIRAHGVVCLGEVAERAA